MCTYCSELGACWYQFTAQQCHQGLRVFPYVHVTILSMLAFVPMLGASQFWHKCCGSRDSNSVQVRKKERTGRASFIYLVFSDKQKPSQKTPDLYLCLISQNFVTSPPLTARGAEKISVYLVYCCPEHNLGSLSKDTGGHEHRVGKTGACQLVTVLRVFS